MIKKILLICGLITGLAGAFAVLQQVDGRYATAAEVGEVAEKVKKLTKEQRRHQIQVDMKDVRGRLWAMEDRWAEKYSAQTGHLYDSLEILKAFMTPEAREQFRALEVEYEDLEKELKKLDPPPAKEKEEDDE